MNKTLIIILLGLLVSKLCFGDEIEKEIKCPIDDNIFKIRVTVGMTTSGSLYDFQKQGDLDNFYENSVVSCPLCHYCGNTGDFDTTFTQKTKQEILKILEPYKQSIMTEVLEIEIAIKIHQYFKRNNDDIANMYLIASYFLKGDTVQTSKRKELQQNSALYLIKAVELKEYNDKETYATINYLIGELYRRIGNFEMAIKYYDLALNDSNKKAWLLKVVTKQKELAINKNEDNSI
jgi:tetratricopeptide (TPR) repeat protein